MDMDNKNHKLEEKRFDNELETTKSIVETDKPVQNRFKNFIHTFCHNFSVRVSIYGLMLIICAIIKIPFGALLAVFSIIAQMEGGADSYRIKEKEKRREFYKGRGEYDQKIINHIANVLGKTKNIINKMFNIFSTKNREQKFTIAFALETIIYDILIFTVGGPTIVLLYAISAFTTFGLDFGLYCHDISKKVINNNKKSEPIHEEISNDTEQDKIEEQSKLNIEVKSSSEIARIKIEYISLIDLVKKYQSMIDKGQLNSNSNPDSSEEIVDSHESNNYSSIGR